MDVPTCEQVFFLQNFLLEIFFTDLSALECFPHEQSSLSFYFT